MSHVARSDFYLIKQILYQIEHYYILAEPWVDPVRLRLNVACLHGSCLTSIIYFNHANTQFTHLCHICHNELSHCSKWLAGVMQPVCHPNQCIHFQDIHFQEIVASGNILFTGPKIPKINNCYNANLIVTLGTASYHNGNPQRPGDDKVGVMSTFGFQWHTKYLANVLW